MNGSSDGTEYIDVIKCPKCGKSLDSITHKIACLDYKTPVDHKIRHANVTLRKGKTMLRLDITLDSKIFHAISIYFYEDEKR